MLDKALHLVQVLHDDIRTSKMETIVENFRASREDMEIHKTNLENQLDQQLRDIREQKAALDRKAQEAKENMIEQDMENTKSISSLFERSISDMIFDSSRTEPIQGESREPELKSPENDTHPSSDVDPTQPDRHEPEIGMPKHQETANGNLENIYGSSYEGEYDAPEQDDQSGGQFPPTQSRCHEAESASVQGPNDTNGGSEPISYETGVDALDNDERPCNGEDDVFDSGVLGQRHNTDSDLEKVPLGRSKTEKDYKCDGSDIDSTQSESDIVPPAGYELEEHGILDIRHKRWYRERYQR